MKDRDEPNLTDEDKTLLFHLARRQREIEGAEADVVSRITKRADMAQSLWKVGATAITCVVLTTLYLNRIDNRVDANTKRSDQLEAWFHQMQTDVTNLRIEMKDKANRHE